MTYNQSNGTFEESNYARGFHADEVMRAGVVLEYRCQDCELAVRQIAVWLESSQRPTLNTHPETHATVLGRWPSEETTYELTAPEEIRAVLGEDGAALFGSGLRCEERRLGIGAFAYYRRLVELQKNRLIDGMLEVSRLTNAPPEVISDLKRAREERSFSRAVGTVRVPPALLLHGGHSPLMLLHELLSEGIHGGGDGECLEIAGNLRVVLRDLVGRMNAVMGDDKQLEAAVNHLLERQRRKRAAKGEAGDLEVREGA
ncbi:MAG TPA: hypothetical protein VNB06_14070 [Thermoanaerobaculia bacterium]|nr:hypothetical protein [Thermoanaerobaculia bacterium]